MDKKEEVKLSIVVLMCDKDYKEAEKLIKRINERVKINHEIVICDNREKRIDYKFDGQGAKIFRPGKNLYVFEGRRQAVLQMCKGEYIWFVDADDDICPVEKFGYDEDLVCFNYWAMSKGMTEPLSCGEPYFVSYTADRGNFFCYSWRAVCKNMVWNKFYRRDVLLGIYRQLPDGLEINFVEDTLLNTLVLGSVKNIRFLRDYFYIYYFESGDTTKEKYDDLSVLVRAFVGFDTALGLLQTLLSAEKQDITGISAGGFYAGSALFFLKKILACTESIRSQFVDFCEKYYTRAYLRGILSEAKDFTEEEKKIIGKALEPRPLVILGKGDCEFSVEQIKLKGCEVWTVGTNDVKGCDRYYEWHGIDTDNDCIRDYPEYLKKYYGLPLNNSISNMLLIAYEEGYKHIELLGCQMLAKEEYVNQRTALGMVAGFLMGKGLEINWIGAPNNEKYGAPSDNITKE